METESLKAYEKEAEQRGISIHNSPAGRQVKPEDVADLVAFLCSEESFMVRGQVIIIDGGLSLIL